MKFFVISSHEQLSSVRMMFFLAGVGVDTHAEMVHGFALFMLQTTDLFPSTNVAVACTRSLVPQSLNP